MKKKMTKSQSNKMLTGTLAGIAEYFGIDPTIVRVAFVFISVILVGAPIFLYLLLMLLIPKASSDQTGSTSDVYQKHPSDDSWNDF